MLFLAGVSGRLKKWARLALAGAAVVHLVAIGWHHVQGMAPEITAPQSLISIGVFCTVVAYLLLTRVVKTTGIGGILAPISVVILGTLINNEGVVQAHLEFVRYVTPLHIVTSTIGFLFFGVAFIAAVLRILADMRLRERGGIGRPRLPPISTLDRYALGSVRLGFPFYTAGIALGAVWAYWGSTSGGTITVEYILGIASWMLYAILVYMFSTTGWRGRKAAVLIIAGFMATGSIVLMYALRRLA